MFAPHSMLRASRLGGLPLQRFPSCQAAAAANTRLSRTTTFHRSFHVGAGAATHAFTTKTRLFLRSQSLRQLRQLRRWLSSSTTSSSSSIAQPTSRWHRLATLVRYTRIPILVFSVYSLGYQQGIIDCTKTPKALQENLLQSILLSSGIKSTADVKVIDEDKVPYYSSKPEHRVAAVGHKIILAAREYVESELQLAMDARKAQLPPDMPEEDALKEYEKDDTVQFWVQARLRLQGEDVKTKPWKFIFIDTEDVNAFVTEILPQRFFITNAMLKVAETPDELAVVLGHEISHLLLGHVSQTNQVETFLRALEVLLLTMDPTAGLLSIFFIAGVAGLRNMVSAAHSRENEREADDLGIVLAARACFNTQKGAAVMHKLHALNFSMSGGALKDVSAVRLLDTHPPSLERAVRMDEQVKTENWTKYTDDQCAGITSLFYNALWGNHNASSKSSSSKSSK